MDINVSYIRVPNKNVNIRILQSADNETTTLMEYLSDVTNRVNKPETDKQR